MRLTEEQISNRNYQLPNTLKLLAYRNLGGFLLEFSAIAALVGCARDRAIALLKVRFSQWQIQYNSLPF